MAIKISIGKLTQNVSDATLRQFLVDNAIELLPISFDHTQHVKTLPFHHRDPFDRMLIAQAMVEGLTILTVDSEFSRYPVTTLW